jgi:hypothetical protein
MTEDTLTAEKLNQAVLMRTLMPDAQGGKLAETLREAGALFRTSVLNDIIDRLMDAWKGLPYANENSPATAPDNIAWLHYYTPTQDWLVTRRFFDVRDCKVFGKTMFYAARVGRDRLTGVTYGHFMLDDIKARNARLDLYWTPQPVNDALRNL